MHKPDRTDFGGGTPVAWNLDGGHPFTRYSQLELYSNVTCRRIHPHNNRNVVPYAGFRDKATLRAYTVTVISDRTAWGFGPQQSLANKLVMCRKHHHRSRLLQ